MNLIISSLHVMLKNMRKIFTDKFIRKSFTGFREGILTRWDSLHDSAKWKLCFASTYLNFLKIMRKVALN